MVELANTYVARPPGPPNRFQTIALKAVQTIARGLGLADPRLYQHSSAGPTYAGEQVTIDSALQLDTVWACVRLKAQTVATLPVMLYTRDAQGFGTVNRDHPLYPLLHDQPNADMTAAEFWEAMVGSLLLWGNAYAQIVWAGTRVIALTPMRPDRVTARRQEDGSLLYHYSYMGIQATMQEAEVFHIKGFSLDGLVGISPVAQGRNSIGTSMAAEKASGSFFRNGMRPSVVLNSPTFLTDSQRKRKQEFIDEFSGALNTGRVPLIEGGWKLDTLSLPPEDAQLLATRAFNVESLCRWFDVPPVMIGHTQQATAWGSGMEQMMLWFLQFSLRPVLKRIEQAIVKAMLPPAERSKHYVEFNVEGLLRTDSVARSRLYATLVDHGVKTRNEVRALENLPPMDGGDDLTVQSAMLPITMLGQFVRGTTEKPLDPSFQAPGGNASAGKGLPDDAGQTPNAEADAAA
jgi:HK97 family phage portal protein